MVLEVLPVGMLQCNCSILGDEASGEAIVIDPGDDIPRILALLERHHLRVTQILITHAHIDHIAGAARLKARTGAPILYNAHDLELARMMDFQAALLGLPSVPEVPPPDDTLDEGKIIRLSKGPAAPDPISPIAERTDGGANLAPTPSLAPIVAHVLHTPGHTQGSICLYLPEQSLLFAGDTLFAGSVGRTDLPGGDTSALLRSIHQKLLALPDATVVIPGHGPGTTIGDERATNPFLSHF